jgi:hypothetical protein
MPLPTSCNSCKKCVKPFRVSFTLSATNNSHLRSDGIPSADRVAAFSSGQNSVDSRAWGITKLLDRLKPPDTLLPVGETSKTAPGTIPSGILDRYLH